MGIALTGVNSNNVLAALVGKDISARSLTLSASLSLRNNAVSVDFGTAGNSFFSVSSSSVNIGVGGAGVTIGTATGSSGITFTNAGARLQLSASHAGSTLHYETSTSTVTCGSDFACGTNLYTTVLRGGAGAANTINMHPTAGLSFSPAASGRTTFAAPSAAIAAIRINTQAAPTGAHEIGDMYVTTAGVLKICTAAGTPGTWVSVGAQT